MDIALKIALISLIGTVLGSGSITAIVNAIVSHKGKMAKQLTSIQTDVKNLEDKVDKNEAQRARSTSIKLNGYYWDADGLRMEVKEGAWTATSSSAALTILTDNIALDEGLWLLQAQTPTLSGGGMTFTFRFTGTWDLNYNNYFSVSNAGESATGTQIVRVTASGNLRLQTGGSSSRTYSNIDRGWIRAIKLSN